MANPWQTPLSYFAKGMPLATAQTDEGGYYSVQTGAQLGMRPGKYLVSVAAYKKPIGQHAESAPNLRIPKRYLNPDTSGFFAEVQQGTNKSVNFALISK